MNPEYHAVIGIGCRLPGAINGPAQLWDALCEGRDTITEMPPARWKQMLEELHPSQRPPAPWPAGVLDTIDTFDHRAFRIGSREAAVMDPQQRMLLEVAVEALHDAGVAPATMAGTRTGVFVGAASFDQASARTLAPGARASMAGAGGAAMAVLSNRISYALDLRGPSETVDTACSSSLVALHHARQSLALGEVDLAIVAGTNILINPVITAAFVDGRILSETQERIRPFDVDGDGYVRSEGVAAVVLAPHQAPQTRNGRAYALVAGTATNSDGRSTGLFAPRTITQVAVLRDALANAGISPEQVDYVEAHGTATAAGDKVEATALNEVFGGHRDAESPLLVGSVKANLGHLEGAAGITNLIKAALTLHHGQIPPTINHDTLRPELAELPIAVPTCATEWPRPTERWAVASSFGFGGTNAAALITAAPPATPPTPRADDDLILIPLSAATSGGLAATASAWADQINAQSLDLGSVAATARHRRDHHRHRTALVTTTRAETVAALRAVATGRPHQAVAAPRRLHRNEGLRPILVFAGHGAHHAHMGVDLAARLPVFAAAVDAVRDALSAHTEGPVWAPGGLFRGFADIQHATFIVQVALARTWQSWGITPGAVIGHSLGEAAAAYSAGVLSLDDAARLVAARSALLAATVESGGMLATALSPAGAQEAIGDRTDALTVAVHNASAASVISGAGAALAVVRAELEAAGVWCSPVKGAPPAHSPLLGGAASELESALAPITARTPEVPLISTCTGATVSGPAMGPAYWALQLRSPVRLAEAITTASAGKPSVFVEVASRGVLGGHIGDTLLDTASCVVPAGRLDEGHDEYSDLLTQAASLYTHGPLAAPAPDTSAPVPLATAWDHGGPGPDPALDLPAELDTATDDVQRRDRITTALRWLLADVVAADPADLDPDQDLSTMGVTSIRLPEVHARIQAMHPRLRSIPLVTLIQNQTPAGLVRIIDQHTR